MGYGEHGEETRSTMNTSSIFDNPVDHCPSTVGYKSENVNECDPSPLKHFESIINETDIADKRSVGDKSEIVFEIVCVDQQSCSNDERHSLPSRECVSAIPEDSDGEGHDAAGKGCSTQAEITSSKQIRVPSIVNVVELKQAANPNSDHDVAEMSLTGDNSIDAVVSSLLLFSDCQLSDQEGNSLDAQTGAMRLVAEPDNTTESTSPDESSDGELRMAGVLVDENISSLEPSTRCALGDESTDETQGISNTETILSKLKTELDHDYDGCVDNRKNKIIISAIESRKTKKSKRKQKPDLKFICDICGSVFTSKDTLNTHIQKHKGRTFDCEMCTKQYKAKEDLKRHIAVKHQEKRYECIICDKSFLSPSGLLRHKKEHEEQYKFSCPVCSRSFNYKSHFDSHMAAHNNIKPHKCDKCDKSYVYSSSLAHHRVNCGDREKSIWCKICNKGFIHKAYLRRHMSVHMDTQVQCSDCGCFFANKNTLTKHKERKHSGKEEKTHGRKKKRLVEPVTLIVNKYGVSSDINIEAD